MSLMARRFEFNYSNIVNQALRSPLREGRNGVTHSFFPGVLFTEPLGNKVPLLMGRKIFWRGVVGEFAAFMRGPKHVADFEKFGCNYWAPWAKADGSIELDYGNAWLEHGQIEHIVNCLENNPTDRRMLITGWRPERLKELDLPCCHYAYQFYVGTLGTTKTLNILWNQRSTDVMIGLPSDLLLAYLWLVAFCKATKEAMYVPGTITMVLGDTHIYSEHTGGAQLYLNNVRDITGYEATATLEYAAPQGTPVQEFDPSLVFVNNYEPKGNISFTVKA